MSDATLRPCPLCAKDTVRVREHYFGAYVVVCDDGCGARGPTAASRADAIVRWNTRAPDPRVGELTAERDSLIEQLNRADTATLKVAAQRDELAGLLRAEIRDRPCAYENVPDCTCGRCRARAALSRLGAKENG